jgi:hypothetical protein
VVAPAVSASPPAPTPAAALEKGKLQEISAETSRLLRLSWCGPNLRLDRRCWASQPDEDAPGPEQGEPVPNGFDQTKCPLGPSQLWELCGRLKSAAGYAASSSTTTGEGNRFGQFSGGGLEARLALTGPRIELSLREERPPGRALELCEDGEGLLRISISGGRPARPS